MGINTRTLSNLLFWLPSFSPIGLKKHIHAKTRKGLMVEKERARRRVRGARRGVRREVGLRVGDVLCRGVSGNEYEVEEREREGGRRGRETY